MAWGRQKRAGGVCWFGFCSTLSFSSAVVRELGTRTELGRGGFVPVSLVNLIPNYVLTEPRREFKE